MKLKGLFLIILLTLALVLLCACDTGSDKDSGTDAADTVYGTNAENDTETVFPFVNAGLSEREIMFIEELFGKKISEVSEADVNGIKAVTVVGCNVSEFDYIFDASAEGYNYKDKLYSYGEDYGDVIHVLENFKNLNRLNIYFCPTFSDISFIKDMERMKELKLMMTGVKDLTVIESFDRLELLTVRATPIEKIAFSEKAPLDFINISDASISSLEPFSVLDTTVALEIIDNRVPFEDTDVIADIKSLVILEMSAPEFDTGFIGEMKSKLGHLTLGGYDEMDLSGISNHKNSLGSFNLVDSSNTDLSFLDVLDEECSIQTYASPTDKRGQRTELGAENYSDKETRESLFGWYVN